MNVKVLFIPMKIRRFYHEHLENPSVQTWYSVVSSINISSSCIKIKMMISSNVGGDISKRRTNKTKWVVETQKCTWKSWFYQINRIYWLYTRIANLLPLDFLSASNFKLYRNILVLPFSHITSPKHTIYVQDSFFSAHCEFSYILIFNTFRRVLTFSNLVWKWCDEY